MKITLDIDGSLVDTIRERFCDYVDSPSHKLQNEAYASDFVERLASEFIKFSAGVPFDDETDEFFQDYDIDGDTLVAFLDDSLESFKTDYFGYSDEDLSIAGNTHTQMYPPDEEEPPTVEGNEQDQIS